MEERRNTEGSKLFTPYKLGPVTLRNRTIRSAAFESMGKDFGPTQQLKDYHVSVARGGIGMTTVAYASVNRSGISFNKQLWLRPEIVPQLRDMTDAIHREGAAAGIQIGHCGNMTHWFTAGCFPVGASTGFNLYSPTFVRGMRRSECVEFAKDFGNETDHTALNAELDKASNSINDIRANLALIQADDGKIRASSITSDSLAQEVLDYVQAKALAGANAVADAATAIAREAQQQAENAVQTATGAQTGSEEAVTTAHAAQELAQQADGKAEQALGETAQIGEKVTAAVDAALHDAVIPGLTPETIEGALGYIPYDGETNSKDFATNAEVAGAIAAIPEPVNADWNASKGAAAILNKPVLSAVATSGNYADLNGKPTLSAVATSGRYSDLAGTPDIIATACPVGMIYGLFFRAEGGAAAAFGETQGGGAPNITGSIGNIYALNVSGAFYVQTGNQVGHGDGSYLDSVIGFSAANANATYGAADEIRPANSTIRIWKRTA